MHVNLSKITWHEWTARGVSSALSRKVGFSFLGYLPWYQN